VGYSCLNEEQILKKKLKKIIVESDTDEDDQMFDMNNDEDKVVTFVKSAKHEALEKALATGE
jgi:hypothetical protein